MKVIADFVIYPIGTADYDINCCMEKCEEILKQKSITFKFHENGCNIEGEFDNVIEAIKCVQLEMHKEAPRVSSDIRLLSESDRCTSIDDQIRKVENKIQAK